MSEFSCVSDHHATLGQVFSVGLYIQHVEDGQNEDCCFAGSWFCLAEHVSRWIGYDLGNSTELYFAGKFKAIIFDALENFFFEQEVTPLDE